MELRPSGLEGSGFTHSAILPVAYNYYFFLLIILYWLFKSSSLHLFVCGICVPGHVCTVYAGVRGQFLGIGFLF